MPNLLFGDKESGFGHPGHDKGRSAATDDTTIVSTSNSGKWQLRWKFNADDVRLSVERADESQPYWFLYEGPIGGRWSPANQYFATDTTPPIDQPHDYFKGDRLFDHWRWAYFGDKQAPRVMYIIHEQQDKNVDTFAHLGNTKQGLDSPDGMVVFGFGRGRMGIEPLLVGSNSFRIGFLEDRGDTLPQYRMRRAELNQLLPNEKD